jgi:addiction module RelE/StbE family toxin
MRVRFTRPARANLQSIYDYISQDDPRSASHLIAQLIERARSLGENPHEGRETDEAKARVVVVPKLRYFIFYSIENGEVHITHIRHTSRQRPPGWER